MGNAGKARSTRTNVTEQMEEIAVILFSVI